MGLISPVKKTRLNSPILERIFSSKYKPGADQVEFARDDTDEDLRLYQSRRAD